MACSQLGGIPLQAWTHTIGTAVCLLSGLQWPSHLKWKNNVLRCVSRMQAKRLGYIVVGWAEQMVGIYEAVFVGSLAKSTPQRITEEPRHFRLALHVRCMSV